VTNRAPRSTNEDPADRQLSEEPSEAVPEPAAPLAPSLMTAIGAEPIAGAAAADPIVAQQLELAPEEPDEEPSSRELIELTEEDLESLQGVASSSVGEPAEPFSETEEVTADQLIQDEEAPAVPIESTPSGPFEPVVRESLERPPPWVDQVVDPVTPYEHRVSETIKLADLPPVEQLRGRVLANRYLAEELAEQTAASLSYRAYHLALDRAVTVRILPRGLACSDELCQEVRSVARVATLLNHPNVAGTLDFGVTSDGWPFLVTEVVQGRSLAVLRAEEGKFVLRRVLHIGKQLAAGLAAAHQAGLVHGLLAPDSVMVMDPGTSAEVASIIGFGVHAARGPTPAPPRSGVFGVPFYVSPEQASCRALDARSDLYSVGVILYELMTGAPPFADGDFAAVLCQHLDDDAEPPSGRLPSPGALAKAMDAIIERLLRKDPEQRYQTAADLGDDLIRLEAAAARNKRRPMPEIQRPTTMIHSPPPRADSSHASQGAKVIVHGEPEDGPSDTPSSPGVDARASSPGAPPVAARAAVTAAPRGALGASAAKRPMRVSVDQATIKISAVDRELALALHRSKHKVPQSGGSERHGLMAALARACRWFVRLFGGGPKPAALPDPSDSGRSDFGRSDFGRSDAGRSDARRSDPPRNDPPRNDPPRNDPPGGDSKSS
jgi:serine/threonine protein kinase